MSHAGNIVSSRWIAACTDPVVPRAFCVRFAFGALLACAAGPCADAAAANASTVQLTSIVNSASYQPGAVAPGELVSLFGQGLGPAEGVQPTVTLQIAFPPNWRMSR